MRKFERLVGEVPFRAGAKVAHLVESVELLHRRFGVLKIGSSGNNETLTRAFRRAVNAEINAQDFSCWCSLGRSLLGGLWGLESSRKITKLDEDGLLKVWNISQ